MPTYTYLQISPVTGPDAPTASRVHTDGPDFVMDICYYAPAPCRVMKMLYQITETLAIDTIAAVIALAKADRDGASNITHITASETTLVDGTAAADTMYEVEIPGGYPIPEGKSVVAILHTAGTDSGAVAGKVKIWAVVQPSEL